MVQATGLDPTGVAVTEAGHATQGGPAYLGALAAYGTGTAEGRGLWLGHCADGHRGRRRAGRADLRRGARRPARLRSVAAGDTARDVPRSQSQGFICPGAGYTWRHVDGRESDDHRDPIGHPRAGSPLVDRS